MKRTFLFGYLMVCITLIVIILVNGLDGSDGDDAPSYFRNPVQTSEFAFSTPTAGMSQPAGSTLGTPSPTSSHEEGSGTGIHHTETAEAYAATLTALPTIED